MLNLSNKQSREIVYDASDDFTIVYDKRVKESRWSIIHEIVIQCNKTKKFYKSGYSVGSDERPFEYSDPEWVEVIPKKVTITVYVSEE